ncbi:glycosyltransferase family 1 protein [Georgenia sp. Z1344]|uniref:glycosyltransferase family 1 protein n=1 Tax=Georgenia sp. Z1344 TaxID=3416706 RepID=UPI003CE6A966
MTQAARLLILSFSSIATDPRVLKQVRYLTDRYEVTTCGYGPAPEGVADHVELPAGRTNKLDGRLITLRAYRAALWRQNGMRTARSLLSGREFDAVLANDIEAVPVALGLKPRGGVHADMHEFFPRWREDDPLWRKRIGPYYRYLCRRYLPRAAAVTTVSGGIARAYTELTGADVGVVTNATPFHDLSPTPVATPIRVVHSGASIRRRHLDRMIEAAGKAADAVTLDLYLVKHDPACFDELQALAATTSNVRVLDPVPYESLIDTLNGYDVGLYVLPATGFNHEHALPNKIFDYVQARLGIVVGPSPEMAQVVREHELGDVTDTFEVDDVAATLRALEAERVERWKSAAHTAATELAAERALEGWGRPIAHMVGA